MTHDDAHTYSANARTHRHGSDGRGGGDGPRQALSRRALLAAAGGTVVTGLAGCQDLTGQSFEAAAVRIPDAARGELVLAESLRESPTLEFDDPRGDGQITITNQTAVYHRGSARGTPTALEAFTGMVNGTPGSGSNINAVASEIGIDQAALGVFEGTPTVTGDDVSVVLPAGARASDGSVMHGKLMALILGENMTEESLVYDGEQPGVLLPGDAYFPVNTDLPEVGVVPPGDMWVTRPDNPEAYRVLVPNAEQFSDWFDAANLPEGAETVAPGDTLETTRTVFSSRVADFENPHDLPPAREIYDAGVPLPLGGSPFGLGVLATPSASVAGQTLNPLVGLETGELLRRDAFGRILSATGVTDAPDVPWLAGPQMASQGWWDPSEDAGGLELLGEETDVETFVGVVEGDAGPWTMALNVVRVTPDDHVVAVAARWRPVGTVDGGMGTFDSAWWSPTEPGDGLSSTNTLVAAAIAGLERV